MNRLNPHGYFAYCPEVKDHDNNSSKSIRRGFANNGAFYYSGYVHEELRQTAGNKIQDVNIGVVIHHDGYTREVLKTKDKYNRNKSLNLKNMQKEPDSLRWNFFISVIALRN